jgi:hypothetical protein
LFHQLKLGIAVLALYINLPVEGARGYLIGSGSKPKVLSLLPPRL